MNNLFIIAILIVALWFLIYRRKNKEPKFEFIITDEIREILDILNNTSDSIFITGKAGTGKSQLLKYFSKTTHKNHVILAPTGVAALNVGGQTIHSFFQFRPAIIDINQIQTQFRKVNLFKNTDTIIIDEVSMVRADLMHGIDIALRKNRNINSPFGNVQMVFIGDLFQLPPVVKNKDKNIIYQRYKSEYFFDAPVFTNYKYHFKELTKIFRQNENQKRFKDLLNSVRINDVNFDELVLLNSRHIENVSQNNNSIFLTTKRDIARNINLDKLNELKDKEHELSGIISGSFEKIDIGNEQKLDDKLPAPYRLKLKKDAQIMMLKNDSGKRWVNGSIGKIVKIEDDLLHVKINNKFFRIEREIWKDKRYILNTQTNKIDEIIKGEYKQFPLQLAWAITIHKSQGKTFDEVNIDIGRGAFAHGQVYVALSRCTSFEGIVINNEIKAKDIIVDQRVVDYFKTFSIK